MPLRDVSSEADPEAAALAFMQRRFEEPFALEGKPLFRYDLIKLADDHYYWCCSITTSASTAGAWLC